MDTPSQVKILRLYYGHLRELLDQVLIELSTTKRARDEG
jgi:hypothetical protein